MSGAYVLRGARVLDEGGGFAGPLDVVVEDGRVAALGASASVGGEVRSFDFAGLWLLPGVFDCHVHPFLSTLDEIEALSTPITQWTLEGACNLRRTLEAGVTFVRDPCGADAGVRAAVEQGLLSGPHLQVSVVGISQTGGHFDGYLAGPGQAISSGYILPDYPSRPPFLADGPDEMRRVVREVLRAGADWVKLCTTGGVLSEHDHGDWPELTREEIEVAVFEAGRRRKGVMAHAFGGEGLENAVRAGVRSIEHGMLLTEEQAALMAREGTFLVPTLAIIRDAIRWADDGKLPDYAERKLRELAPRVGAAVALARDAGVRIAMGSDFCERAQHGRNLEEILYMHEAGLTAEEALLAATRGGAELCGVADRLGRIAPDYAFDAIVLDQDPGDLTLFARPGAVTGVFKGGEAVVPHARLR